MTTEERSAPKELHDELDKLYPLAAHGGRIGMGSQIILSLDPSGKISEFKVNLAKKGKLGIDSA